MIALDDVTFRAFRGRDDYPGVAALVNERIVELGEGEHATADSVAERYDHLRRCDPATDVVMVDAPDGRIVGYARVFWDDIVGEDHRAYYVVWEASSDVEGLADRTLDWGIRRATAIASGHDHHDRRIVTWSVDGTADERAIARAGGFEPFLWSAVMVRPHLGDIPDAPLPEGLEIRPVDTDDLRAIWESDIEAFRDHHGYVEQDETDFARFVDEARRGTSLWQVAWDGDRVAAQVRTRVNDGEAESRGRRRAWTEDISTRREWRGRGAASALIAASLRQLAALGFDEAALGVDLDNPTGALGVYRRMGYEPVVRVTQYSRSV